DWPGGRTNHYQFDMNRDWFALTQIETRGRVQAYLEWFPQVFVDLHEMGSNSTYYFAPPATPLNPEMPAAQVDWLKRFGKNNARWFDRMQFDYFTHEVFDSFYPGYGEGWPMIHGSIGMTYEQASSRGLVVKRDDETTMHYRDTVQHHFISSLATAENTARNHDSLLRYFYKFRQSAIQEGNQERVKEFIIQPGSDPNRAAKLASNLLSQGIEVKQAKAAFTNSKVRDYYDDKLQSKKFPAGTYLVSLAQPEKHLVKTLLAKHTPMAESFIKKQIRRYKKRLRDQIYDVTGWSLPLLYDVDCYMAETASRGQFEVLENPVQVQGQVRGAKAHLAYLIPWGTNSAAKALAQIFQEKLQVFCADKSFKLNSQNFPRGSLIIKVKNNPPDLHQRLEKIAASTGVDIYPTNSAWVEEGINFGSNQVRFLKKPKIAMAYQIPTRSYSVGWTRYLLEQEFSYPVTIINTLQLGRIDLNKYNVLILPDAARFLGGYGQILGESGANKIKTWVQNGGTLVTIGEATHWLTGEKVGLLATTRELKGGKPEKSKQEEKKPEKSKQPSKPATSPAQPGATPQAPFDLEKAIQPEKELPGATPGAIMRVKLDMEHWLAFGYDGDTNVLVSSRNIFTPMKLDKGRNIGLYMPEDKLLVSGFTWQDAKKQIANKAYLMYQPLGRGHVVAFAEDPNYRAFMDGLNLLFMNAIFFGPGH
ncbi:MAG: M14 family metallopeptidase, partial [bacterium]